MNRPVARVLGGSSMVGALLAVVTAMPSRWYGYRETDAHVFAPEPATPLWIERTLMPWVSALAAVLLLAGIAGLVIRDRPVAARLRRWAGYVAVVGVALLALTSVLFAVAPPTGGGADALAGALVVVLALVLGLGGLVLSGVGLVAAGIGYARTDRPRVGYAMAGGTGLAVVAVAVGFVVEFDPLGVLPVVTPLAVVFAAVGYDLASHPEPLPDPDDPGEYGPSDAGGTAGGDAAAADPGTGEDDPPDEPSDGNGPSSAGPSAGCPSAGDDAGQSDER